MTIGELIVSLGVDTSGLNTAQKQMEQFGASATKYLTVPLGLVGVAAFKMGKDFDTSMSRIIGLVGESRAQVDAWTKDILASAGDLGRGPNELAEALYFVTSSGIKGAAAMDVVKESAKGAAAGLGETQEIANLVTSAMNAYKKSNLSAATSLDIVTAAVREGKGEARDYASQLGDVIPLAAKMGVSFDQIAGAVSAVTLTGTSVAEGVTQIKGILSSLMDASDGAENALKTMGLSSAGLRKTIREDGLLATLQILNDKTAQYGETVMAEVFPNIRALMGALSLTGDRMADNVILFEEVKNSTGDMAKAFEAAGMTMDQKYNQAIAEGKTALISLGLSMKTTVSSALEGFTDVLKDVVIWFNNLSQGTKDFIVYTAAIAAAIGPVTLAVAGFIKVGSMMITGLRAIQVAWGTLTAIMAANPIMAIATAVALATAAFIAFRKSHDDMKIVQEEVNRQLGTEIFQLNDIFTKLKNSEQGTKDRTEAIKIINTRYGEYLGNLLSEKSTLEDIAAAQKQATNALIASLSVKAYKDKMQGMAQDVADEFNDSFDIFLKGFRDTYGSDRIGEFITAIYTEADNAAGKGATAFNDSFLRLWTGFVEKMSKRAGYLKYDFDDLRQAFANFVSVKSEKNAVMDELQKMIDGYQKLIVVKDQAAAAGGNAGGGGGAPDVGGTASVNPMAGVWPDHSAMASAVAGNFKMPELMKFETPTFDTTPVENYTKQIAGLGSALMDISTKNDILGKSNETLDAQIQYMENDFNALWNNGIRPGNDLMDSLVNKLESARAKQVELSRSTQQLKQVYNALSQTVTSFATAMGEAMVSGGDAFSNLVTVILRGAQQIINILLAEAVAGMIAHEASSKGVIGLAIAAAGVAALMTIWAASTQKTSEAAKMADGGVVPAGYPNDTYPALLSSGETVTPPDKLDDNVTSQASEITVKVEMGELKGTDIHWIVKEVERRYKTAYY